MTATAAMLATVRRYVNEPDGSNGYTDEILTGIIEAAPLLDERGQAPYTWDTSTEPPTQDDNENWLPTYDLHVAAAQVWEEKAASVAHLFTFSADGGQYIRSEQHKQYLASARYHSSRRAPRNLRMVMWPPLFARERVVGNLAEVD